LGQIVGHIGMADNPQQIPPDGRPMLVHPLRNSIGITVVRAAVAHACLL
jgi:hypothetical protein